MSQVEYSLHHCYQQVNDLLACYNGQTQTEGFSSHNKPTDFDKPVRIVRGEADMFNESAFSLNRYMAVSVCPIDL